MVCIHFLYLSLQWMILLLIFINLHGFHLILLHSYIAGDIDINYDLTAIYIFTTSKHLSLLIYFIE